MGLFSTKIPKTEGSGLARHLNLLDVSFIGVGAIIGAGIFVITGQAAATTAGPAIVLSFLVAAVAIGITALIYAEMSSIYPVSGSAYNYTYATLGEFFAWLVGWNLLLEYGVATSAVATGWSGYFRTFIDTNFHIALPTALSGAYDPAKGTFVDLSAFLVIFFIFALLAIGIKESARVNNIIVYIKIAVLSIFVFFGLQHFDINNIRNFFPFGFEGVWHATSLIIFAYLGFDAISTVAEETKDPTKTIPKALMLALAFSTLFFILVSFTLTSMVNYKELNVPDALAFAMVKVDEPFLASIIALGAVVTITTVMLVMGLGFTRVAFALSRDGFLPKKLCEVHPKYNTPFKLTLIGGFFLAFLAGFVPLKILAELVNIGTLFAYFIVAVAIILLRRKGLVGTFRVPMFWVLIPLNFFLLLFIMSGLELHTWIRFVIWSGIGIGIYFLMRGRLTKD
ncbi:amino acid permease [Sulfuricurvum sp.]|uniref:amino acid permease n=1 Tax=Sulfuricurvum sp. TaxID=2025608 RepID=UPI0035676F6E